MSLVVSIVSAVAWPVALVASVFILRDPLSKAISRLIRVRYKDKAFEAEFEQTLERVTQKADDAALPPARAESKASEQTLSIRRSTHEFLDMAEAFPEAAVLEAWRELELAMRETLRTADIDYSVGRPAESWPLKTMIEALRKSHPEPHLFDIVEELRVLRNKVAHSGGVELSPEKAKEYVKLAKRVSDELWRVVGC